MNYNVHYQQQPQQPQWACPACTLHNSVISPVCEACGQANPVKADTAYAVAYHGASAPPESPLPVAQAYAYPHYQQQQDQASHHHYTQPSPQRNQFLSSNVIVPPPPQPHQQPQQDTDGQYIRINSREPIMLNYCPTCAKENVMTDTRTKVSGTTWVCVVAGLLIFWPLCWIPLTSKYMQQTNHYCPSCRAKVGRVKPFQ